MSVQPAPVRLSGISHGSGLAHDASNLLAALGLYTDLLARPGVLRPEHSHYASELRDLAERGGRLMRNLIPHIPVGTSAHAAQPHPSPTDPARVLRDLYPLLVAVASPYAAVAIEAPTAMPEVAFPAQEFERILVNLVRNAAQAIERSRPPASVSPGNIRIDLSQAAGKLRLTVDDDGPGMSAAAAAAFLSPSPLPSGIVHGLGHRIIHELVAATGGTLSVRVRPDSGTSFAIEWAVDCSTICAPASPSVMGLHEVSTC